MRDKMLDNRISKKIAELPNLDPDFWWCFECQTQVCKDKSNGIWQCACTVYIPKKKPCTEDSTIILNSPTGGNPMPWQGKSEGYGQWSDLPIKHDAILPCDHCNTYTPHEVTSYHDCDYRVCVKCGMRTKWVPVRGAMVKDEEKRDDKRWQEDFDAKRDSAGHLGRPKGSKNKKRR
jgi:hypothetical protein